MPKRTNKKQEITTLLRRLLASEGCEVRESEMLVCARTGDRREVDVVMMCKFGDVSVTVSFEVLGRGRKATVEWVEQMLKKHEDLETNKLVLVSWSGFTAAARRRARSDPRAVVVTPEIVSKNGRPLARSLYVDQVTLTARRVVLLVDAGASTPTRVAVAPENTLFKMDGTQTGTAGDLASALLTLPAVGERVVRDVHDHPERDNVRWFDVGVPVPERVLSLRAEPLGELHPIRFAEIRGEIVWSQQHVDLKLMRFGEVVFGHGPAQLGGRAALVVATLSDTEVDRATVRVYGGDQPRDLTDAASTPSGSAAELGAIAPTRRSRTSASPTR